MSIVLFATHSHHPPCPEPQPTPQVRKEAPSVNPGTSAFLHGFLLLQAHSSSSQLSDVCGGPPAGPHTLCLPAEFGQWERLSISTYPHALPPWPVSGSGPVLSLAWHLWINPCSMIPALAASGLSLLNESSSFMKCETISFEGTICFLPGPEPKQQGRRHPRRELEPWFTRQTIS